MTKKAFEKIKTITGDEGSKIRNYFSPNDSDFIRYSIAHFTLEKNKRTKKHKLKSSEVYFIIDGVGTIHCDDEKFHVKKNDSVLIEPNKIQFIENSGKTNLEFLCIVDPAWKKEDEKILE